MDIFRQAIAIEEEGEIFYRDLSSKSKDPGLKRIFTFLAEEESKHKRVFEKMINNETISLKNNDVIEKAKNIFKEMSKSTNHISMENYEVENYRKALSVEQSSIEYYSDILEKVKKTEKETIIRIIDEEKIHYRLIENIIDFVNKPQTWLDNAEWNHLDEY